MKTFLKKLEESIPEIIGGLTVEGILILIGWLLKDYNNWLPLLVIMGGTVWIACGYIAFRYKTLRLRKQLNEKGGKYWKYSYERVWMYPRARPFALFSFIIFPLLIISWLSFDYYQQTKPPDKIVILVADFDGEKPQDYRVTESILVRLRTVLEPYDEVKVEALDKTITEKEGSTLSGKL